MPAGPALCQLLFPAPSCIVHVLHRKPVVGWAVYTWEDGGLGTQLSLIQKVRVETLKRVNLFFTFFTENQIKVPM